MPTRLWMRFCSIVALSLALAACSGSVTQGTPGDAGDDDVPDASPRPDGALPPPEFWDSSDIPPAQNVLMFKFLNRTNGKLDDSHVF